MTISRHPFGFQEVVCLLLDAERFVDPEVGAAHDPADVWLRPPQKCRLFALFIPPNTPFIPGPIDAQLFVCYVQDENKRRCL